MAQLYTKTFKKFSGKGIIKEKGGHKNMRNFLPFRVVFLVHIVQNSRKGQVHFVTVTVFRSIQSLLFHSITVLCNFYVRNISRIIENGAGVFQLL